MGNAFAHLTLKHKSPLENGDKRLFAQMLASSPDREQTAILRPALMTFLLQVSSGTGDV